MHQVELSTQKYHVNFKVGTECGDKWWNCIHVKPKHSRRHLRSSGWRSRHTLPTFGFPSLSWMYSTETVPYSLTQFWSPSAEVLIDWPNTLQAYCKLREMGIKVMWPLFRSPFRTTHSVGQTMMKAARRGNHLPQYLAWKVVEAVLDSVKDDKCVRRSMLVARMSFGGMRGVGCVIIGTLTHLYKISNNSVIIFGIDCNWPLIAPHV